MQIVWWWQQQQSSSWINDNDYADLSNESDAAVGAFVQLIQDAPPLQRSVMPQQSAALSNQFDEQTLSPEESNTMQFNSQEMTVQAGLDQLAKFRKSLRKPEGSWWKLMLNELIVRSASSIFQELDQKNKHP